MQVVKVPGFAVEKNKDCKNSGNALLRELKRFQYNEEGVSTEAAFLNLEEIHLDNSNVFSKDELIYENALEIFGSQERAIFLGGDHSITFPLAKAFLFDCKLNQKESCLIVFDARVDCGENSKNKSKSWLKDLILSGFPSENILLVGVRSFSKKEKGFLKNQKVKRISTSSFLEDIGNACDTVMEFSSGKDVYVSIDFNILDPTFMPSVSEIIPGGFSSMQLIYLLQRIKKIRTLRAIDLVELNSEDKESEKSVLLGSKILSEIF